MSNDATNTASSMSRPDKQELWKAFLAGFMESTSKSNGEIFNCGSIFKSPYKDDSYCCDQCAKEATACGIV